MSFTRKDFIKTSALLSLSATALGVSACKSEAEPSLPLVSSSRIKPKALKAGDTLGLVAPASPIYQSSVFDEMLANLEELGFRLKLGEFVRNQRGYLAGTDEQRAQDLMNMFRDPEVDGIMAIRGGWGCNRILPLLDYDVFRNNPKVFCGFSDITSLHLAMYLKSDLITFHGPVGKSVWNEFTTQAFKKIVFKGEQIVYSTPPEFDETFTITEGQASGKLMAGNLSVLVSMIGSDYLPSFKGSILMLEDIGESVYRIDRMLTQLKLAGILDELNGFVFGKCTDCEAGQNSLTLEQVFDDHIKPLNIPSFYGAMISHEDNNITIPVGIEGIIDSAKKTIQVSHSGVTQ